MQYKDKSTGVVFPQSQLPERFPNTSIPAVMTLADLAFLNLEEVPDPAPTPPTPEEFAAQQAALLASAKAAKNLQINDWREAANLSRFPHAGKQIACDKLSRSDIDAVAGEITLNGAFPAGFPGGWKAIDNTYIALPNMAAFKAMYSSMTTQGTINFGRSQALKAALNAATTIEQVNAITWE